MRNAFDASDPDRRTAAIATTQHGLITRAQARNTGLSDRQVDLRLERGAWERVLPGVFRIAGSPATGRQGMFAATLWAGRRAVLSHSAAGVLWGLDAVRAGALEVTVESPRRLHHPAVVVHRTRALPRLDRVVHDGIRVTSVARTLVDLAGVLVPDHLELAVEDALRRELTSIARIRHRMGKVTRSGMVLPPPPPPPPRPGPSGPGSSTQARARLAYR